MAVIGNAPATTGTTVSAQSFNGDNSTVAFTLTRSVNSTVDLEVLVDNVQQSPYDGSYSVSGTTLTFSAAPATGTNNIYVIYRGATIATAQVIPDDGSVTNAKMASGAALANVGTGNITADYLNIGQIGGRRNLIINGAMQVAQRGTSGTSANSIAYYTVDRFNFRGEPTGVYTIAQDTDAPANFKNSTKITVTTPDTSIPSGERYWVATYLEGNDIAHLNFGSSDAQEITLSFYVKSSLTGTFSGGFGNDGFSRAYVFEYTIDSADTWERKTVTITGDTSGTWLDTNGVGLRIVWDLGAASNRQTTAGAWESSSYLAATGATQVIATNGATWQITGVQLEVGSAATPFEHRSYGEELALCQRYYQFIARTEYSASDAAFATYADWDGSSGYGAFYFPSGKMRAAPTMTNSAGSTIQTLQASEANTVGSFNWNSSSPHRAEFRAQSAGTDTAGQAGWMRLLTGGYINMDAEL
jgi:hypothetical protein